MATKGREIREFLAEAHISPVIARRVQNSSGTVGTHPRITASEFEVHRIAGLTKASVREAPAPVER